MSENNGKPIPIMSPLTAPFWEAARKGKLVLQRCVGCKRFQFYPRPSCSHCGSSDVAWAEVSGRGRVYSFTIIRQVVANVDAFQRDIPFVVALVELNEGPRLISNIVDCKLEDVHIGMEVEVVFEGTGKEIVLPKFKPVEHGS